MPLRLSGWHLIFTYTRSPYFCQLAYFYDRKKDFTESLPVDELRKSHGRGL